MGRKFDVLIVGGGVVGSAIARELSRYRLQIGVLEKNRDVCFETSGRNSAVLHGGFAYDPGTLKARLCVEGNREFDQVAKELDVPFRRTGKVLLGNTPEDMENLRRMLATGETNGSQGLEIIDYKRLHELVPAAVGKFAFYSPNSGILNPFQYTIALAENAAANGVKYFLNTELQDIARSEETYVLRTTQGEFRTSWVINSAGLGCGKISDMLGLKGYRVIGSKGTYIILDKKTGPLLPMPVYPVPSNTYMGIHVTPTVDGNVIVGPDAEYTEDFTNYDVPQKNMDYLVESASQLWPCIHREDYIRNYCGILPKWVDENGTIQDFKIEARPEAPHTVNLVGIESPGLTAALPIARYVISLMKKQTTLLPREDFQPVHKGIVRFAQQDDETRARLIRENPDYGEVICRCEKVTRAEILQAIHNPLGAETVTSIKYRTRCMMGRCQGGYCQMRIAALLEQEKDLRTEDVLYARNGSNLFTGRVKK